MCFIPSVTRARNRGSHLAVTCSFRCDRRESLGWTKDYIDWSHTWGRSSEASSLGLCLLPSRSIWKTSIYLLWVALFRSIGNNELATVAKRNVFYKHEIKLCAEERKEAPGLWLSLFTPVYLFTPEQICSPSYQLCFFLLMFTLCRLNLAYYKTLFFQQERAGIISVWLSSK